MIRDILPTFSEYGDVLHLAPKFRSEFSEYGGDVIWIISSLAALINAFSKDN